MGGRWPDFTGLFQLTGFTLRTGCGKTRMRTPPDDFQSPIAVSRTNALFTLYGYVL